MSRVTYTWNTDFDFYRIVSGEFQDWFSPKVIYTKDALLDSTSVLDQANTQDRAPLTIRAALNSGGNRDDVEASIGTTAELSNDRGRDAQACLIEAKRVDYGIPGLYVLDLTFEWRPT
jgi:hypothetical protein